ncbi:MAG: BamA/TamA family outer membrane protein [Cyclobacteriaceae bacterium]|nr:BamA/TamA family outer membrane protein [Cyclobacteriaceae bacterium]
MNRVILFFLLLAALPKVNGQSTDAPKSDSLSKFDSFNTKAEAFFKVFPVPIITYSTEAGNTFGLAKFNAFHPVKKDTISKPSKLSEVFTWSTKGRVNVSVSNDLILKGNKYMFLSFFNYRKVPEYILGIGNDVSIDNVEEVVTDRIKFSTIGLFRLKENIYAGYSLDLANYFKVVTDSNSFIIEDNVTGVKGGTDAGVGVTFVLDSRTNRYNASDGAFFLANLITYPKFLGSDYQFTRFELDGRKYYNPWRKHVIALQTTATFIDGNVPFYDLAMLGGEDKMRGYYKGALRDKVLIDAQVEYRMPIWKIFGLTTWVATGRVAENLKDFSLDELWLSYGCGVRIKVDSKSDINLRIDMGFGPGGINGLYLNFAEAF